MLYSRFNAERGLYDVFEDGAAHALNADFPVPKLGGGVPGVGVPATEAGRPLPAAARYVGESWHARGLVVTPARSAGLGLPPASDPSRYVVPAAVVVGVAVLWWVWRREHAKPLPPWA